MNAVPGKTLIVEVALELGIDPAFVEKDWFVVQVIREIVNTDLFGAQLIFTGGTALSKAHCLIQRFSEDIDFRLILPQQPLLSRSGRRKLLSAIRDRLREVVTIHFPSDVVKWKARDENHFFSFDVDYPSVVDPSAALRPHLQIEFAESTLSLPPLLRPVSSLIAELRKADPEIPAVTCIDPVENAVDKVSALVWRVPDRVRQPEDDDPDLARHIHDLAVLQPYAMAHADFKHLTIGMIHRDDHRCNMIIGLPLEQKFQILMEILMTEKEYATEYTRFVQGMSYAAGGVPTYAEAMTKVKALVDHLLKE
jgi:predicted nucleotidyltransferase component of viral defense system